MEKNKIKAIIFDLDGVICSTDRSHYKAWKTLSDKYGFSFDESVNERLRGISRMASLEIILENSGVELPQDEKTKLTEEKNTVYRESLSEMNPDDLAPETKETLDELRSRGYLLAIGSSSKNAKYILERIGLGDYFDAIADGTDISRSKPDPEVFLKAAEKLGMPPEDCVVIEDAKSGIQAAKAAGMTAFAFHGDAEGCGLEDRDLGSFKDIAEYLD